MKKRVLLFLVFVFLTSSAFAEETDDVLGLYGPITSYPTTVEITPAKKLFSDRNLYMILCEMTVGMPRALSDLADLEIDYESERSAVVAMDQNDQSVMWFFIREATQQFFYTYILDYTTGDVYICTADFMLFDDQTLDELIEKVGWETKDITGKWMKLGYNQLYAEIDRIKGK